MTTTVTVQRPSKTGGSSRSKDRRSKKSRPADAQGEAQPESRTPAAPRRAPRSAESLSAQAALSAAQQSAAAERYVLATATAADHPAVQQLICTAFSPAMHDPFVASLDDPFYEPSHRLVVRCGAQIVAHAHIVERVMHFGSIELPVARLVGLATHPDFRSRGLARALVTAAERTMRRNGSVLGLLSTRIPRFFGPQGWALCGRYTHSRAGTRDLLAQLSAHGVAPGEGSVAIRPWRQVELPGLMRLYAERTVGACGALQRTEAYWRWLVSRQEFDQIFVALEGSDHFDWASLESPIAGYVVLREDRILELTARPSPSQASALFATPTVSIAKQLLARACSEAIERDYYSIQLHAAPDEPLHQLFLDSAGELTNGEAHHGEVLMAKLFDAPALVRHLADELLRRATEASLPRSVELGLMIEGQKHRLVVSRRKVRLERGKLGRSYLKLNEREFTRLLMGHLDLAAAVEQGRVRASTRLAQDTAAALFPRLPYWGAPWDDVVC